MRKIPQTPMTTAEVAKALDKDPKTIQRWAKSGVLPSTKLAAATGTYLFNRADVEALLSPAARPVDDTPVSAGRAFPISGDAS